MNSEIEFLRMRLKKAEEELAKLGTELCIKCNEGCPKTSVRCLNCHNHYCIARCMKPCYECRIIICVECEISDKERCNKLNEWRCYKCHFKKCVDCFEPKYYRFLPASIRSDVLHMLLVFKKLRNEIMVPPKFVKHLILKYIVINGRDTLDLLDAMQSSSEYSDIE